MSKKYPKRREPELDAYYKVDDDKFESQYDDEEDSQNDVNEEENGEETNETPNLEKGREILLKEITSLKNGEDRTRAIGDLKEIEAIMFARRRYERKKEQMAEDESLRQKELEENLKLKREEMERDFEIKQKELEQDREKLEKELALKEKEIYQNCELQEKQIKVQKRSTIIGAITNVLLTFVSLGAYNYMLDKQNKFESNETYSTSGSRGLTNNISRIPSVFGKR